MDTSPVKFSLSSVRVCARTPSQCAVRGWGHFPCRTLNLAPVPRPSPEKRPLILAGLAFLRKVSEFVQHVSVFSESIKNFGSLPKSDTENPRIYATESTNLCNTL